MQNTLSSRESCPQINTSGEHTVPGTDSALFTALWKALRKSDVVDKMEEALVRNIKIIASMTSYSVNYKLSSQQPTTRIKGLKYIVKHMPSSVCFS